jgi:hypothetical protein
MATEKPTKQELMNKKREETKQQVRASMTYECGVCGLVSKVEVRSNEHGLILIPQTYCGSCAKVKNFRLLSGHITRLETKTKAEWDEIDARMVTNCEPIEDEADAESTGTETPNPPAKKKAAGAKDKTS